MTDILEPASAAESAEQINGQRAARQRQQRVLQLEEQIAQAQPRVARLREAAETAAQRAEHVRARATDADEQLVRLERELAQLQLAPIDVEFDEVSS